MSKTILHLSLIRHLLLSPTFQRPRAMPLWTQPCSQMVSYKPISLNKCIYHLTEANQKYHHPSPPPPCFQCDNPRHTSRSAPKQAAKWMSSSGPPSSSSVSSSSSSSASLRWTCFTFSISSLGRVLKSRSNDKSNSKNFLQFSFSWHWSFLLKYYYSNLAKHPLSFSSLSISYFFLL